MEIHSVSLRKHLHKFYLQFWKALAQKVNQFIESNAFKYIIYAQLKCDIFDRVLEY